MVALHLYGEENISYIHGKWNVGPFSPLLVAMKTELFWLLFRNEQKIGIWDTIAVPVKRDWEKLLNSSQDLTVLTWNRMGYLPNKGTWDGVVVKALCY
jgi:hypothetical protein